LEEKEGASPVEGREDLKNKDIVLFSIHSLGRRKLRSWLTVLGVVIGVAAVVALVSIAGGAQRGISQQMGSFGADIITISPGVSRAGGGFQMGGGEPPEGGLFRGGDQSESALFETDVKAVKSVSGVLYVDGIVAGRATAIFQSKNSSVSVEGVDTTSWGLMETTQTDSGRYLASGDDNAVVLGYRVANDIFPKIGLNSGLILKYENSSATFRVVGILKQSGQTDGNVFIPKQQAKNLLDLDQDKVSSITVKAASQTEVETVAAKINATLLITHHVTEAKKDFTITTLQSMQASMSSVSNTMVMFIGGIAAISLVVGGIGIANTLFMSVIERTREIGILKALGASNSDIMKLFLVEAGFIGLAGGAIGALFGVIASGIISEIGLRIMGLTGGGGYVSIDLIVFVLLFSFFVGIASGIFPARMASKLQPTEALRYE
jgi:putative ABC transport system permease protein